MKEDGFTTIYIVLSTLAAITMIARIAVHFLEKRAEKILMNTPFSEEFEETDEIVYKSENYFIISFSPDRMYAYMTHRRPKLWATLGTGVIKKVHASDISLSSNLSYDERVFNMEQKKLKEESEWNKDYLEQLKILKEKFNLLT